MTAAVGILKSAPNFRDFGGARTHDGKRVRTGLLFRSELLLGLDAEDLETLAGLEIGLVCDLRSESEKKRIGNEWPAGSSYQTLSLGSDVDLSAVQPDKWKRRIADPEFGAEQARDALISNYEKMPEGYARELGGILDYLAGERVQPLMIHCAAGKDRTGFVCAMILSALDVPREAIFEDYLETARRYTPEHFIGQRAIQVMGFKTIPNHANPALMVLGSANPDFLNAALGGAESRYGSVENYLEQKCGLTATKRDRIRQALLEEN